MDEIEQISMEEMSLSMQRFSIWDYIVFVIMLFMCCCIGVYWGFMRKQSEQEYLMGGRNMKVFPVSMSLVASFISGISLLGIPTEIYVYGTQYLYITGGIIAMVFIMSKIFLPVFHELQITSSYEYLEMRFDYRLRLLGSALFALGILTWLPIVIYVPALAFNQVSGVNIFILTPLVCLICIFYTCVGGLKAVVWTDVIQTMIMIGAIFLIAIKGTIDIGGISVVIQRNLDSDRFEGPIWDVNPKTRHTVWGLIIGGCFFWLASNAVSQTMVQRYLSLPNFSSIIKTVWCFFVGVLVILFVCSYCGLLTFATYHLCDPVTTKLAKAKDQLLPLLVMDVLGDLPGLPGLFIAGVFSAALSSLSTGLNSLALVVLEDFYKPYGKPMNEKQTAIFIKSVVVVLGVICTSLVILVERIGTTVLQLNATLSAVSGGASLGIFAMGLLFPKIHSTGALIGGLSGLVVLSWICINTQLSIASNALTFTEKPVSTENCHYKFSNAPYPLNFPLSDNATHVQHPEEVFILYQISYLWHPFIGCVLSIIIGLFVSVIWRPIKSTDTDVKYLAPFLRRFYAKPKIDDQELKSIKADHH